jgi:hypothetical protein
VKPLLWQACPYTNKELSDILVAWVNGVFEAHYLRMFQGYAEQQLNALATTAQDNSLSKKSKRPTPSSFEPSTQPAQKSWSIENLIATHKASGGLCLLTCQTLMPLLHCRSTVY